MTYYLRVEGVNLGNFVNDTSDLATIRGGSMLLLDALDVVETVINTLCATPTEKLESVLREIIEIQNDKLASRSEKRKKLKPLRERKQWLKKLEKQERLDVSCTATITKGASWGLFELDEDYATAIKIKHKIVNTFNDDSAYQHATLVVDIYQSEEDERYQSRRDKAQTLNRWQQLKAPSQAISREGEVACTFDKTRPATTQIDLPSDTKKRKRDYASESVQQRRSHGQDQKNHALFYKKTIGRDYIGNLKLTGDLDQLSSSDTQDNLNGKIAFIYIDGNEFGQKQKDSKSPDEQRNFDRRTRKGRESVLKDILVGIKGDNDWLNGDKLRLETLLWGGDEIIWVVPAWQGWWMLKQFYDLAKNSIVNPNQDDQRLYHGSSIIFCRHNAPIHRIDALARRLADDFAKTAEFKKEDRIAYQVLESFDHAGTDLKAYRDSRRKGLSDNAADLLIKAEDMQAIEQSIKELKGNDFPKRKIYQIVQRYRDGAPEKAKELHKKLTGADRTKFKPTRQQEIYTKELGILKGLFGNSNAYWLHLMELWDYVALDAGTEKGRGK